MIAEKMTGEKSRDYMNARRVAKEYEAITRGLDRAFLSLPPCGSIEEIKQVIYFLSFIKVEKILKGKVSFFHQCSKMQIIPIKKFNIQTCFFQFLWFFRLKC